MNSPTPSDKAPVPLRELCFLAIAAALMFAAKVALSSLPNVNLNALIIILVTVYFGWKALYSVGVYILLEGMLYGFGIWWLSYLIVWPVLVIVTMAIRRTRSVIMLAVLAGIFGLVFGPMMYVVYFAVLGGWAGFLPMWIAGIPYDLVHGISNFLTVLLLFRPLSKVFESFGFTQ